MTLSQVDSSENSLNTSLTRVFDLDRSLQKLGEQDDIMKKIMVMRFYGGVEIKDVAESFGMSESTVKRKLRFAKAYMKTQLSTARC